VQLFSNNHKTLTIMPGVPSNRVLRALLNDFLEEVRGHPELVWDITNLRGKGGEDNREAIATALADALAAGIPMDRWVIGSGALGPELRDVFGTSTCTMTLAGVKCEVTFFCEHSTTREVEWPEEEPNCIAVNVLNDPETTAQ